MARDAAHPNLDGWIARLDAAFRAAPWPAPPAGFTLLGDPRPMRALYRGTVETAAGSRRVVVKRSRDASFADRLARLLRGGKAGREARALRLLATRGVRVPTVLGWTADLLVTEEVPDLRPLPDPRRATAAERRAVVGLLARAHEAGLLHRDLTRENVVWAGDAPLLVDLGGARVVGRLSRRRRVTALARARNAFLGEMSRTERWRALREYAEAASLDGDLRAWSRAIEAEANRLARRYRIGRDRRARRSGSRYAVFRAGGFRCVASRDEPAETWKERLPRLLSAEGGVPLKATGRIARLRFPDRANDVVVKRFEPGFRLVPRPLRSFRAAVALEHRFVPTPAPLLAAAARDGGGILVTEHVAGLDLRTALEGETVPAERVRVLRAVGRTLRALHDAGVRHRDLKAQNLVVGTDPATGVLRVLVADVEGVRPSRSKVGWHRRARDLARLDASLAVSDEERAAWLDAYLSVSPTPEVPLEAFDARVRARAAWKRRRKGGVG